MKKSLLIILTAIILIAALSVIPIKVNILIPFLCKAAEVCAKTKIFAAQLSIRLSGTISFQDLQINNKDGLILHLGKGTIHYDPSDILRRQFRIKISAQDVTVGREKKSVKGFIESFLLPDPETKIHFKNAVFSVNFYGGAKELENLQLIGDDLVITGEGKSIGKKSINYSLVLYLSEKTSRMLLAQYGSSPSENSSNKNTILIRMYGEPSFPFIYIITKNLRMSFKVGRKQKDD